MKRNLQSYAESGKKKLVNCYHRYELVNSELSQLFQTVRDGGNDGVFEALSTAFYAGFEAGHRAAMQQANRMRKDQG